VRKRVSGLKERSASQLSYSLSVSRFSEGDGERDFPRQLQKRFERVLNSQNNEGFMGSRYTNLG